LDRILSKQKSSRQKVDGTHHRLKNRNERVNSEQLDIRERNYNRIYDREHEHGADRSVAFSRAYRLSRDQYWEILI
jgi:hypothetical protein